MSDQHHHNPYQRQEPYPSYEPYGPYDAYDPQTDPAPQQGTVPPSYDYGYDQSQGGHTGHDRAPASPAWPQHDHAAQQDPPTQTWQTQTWDTGTWQQPAAPAPEPSYGSPWQTGDQGGDQGGHRGAGQADAGTGGWAQQPRHAQPHQQQPRHAQPQHAQPHQQQPQHAQPRHAQPQQQFHQQQAADVYPPQTADAYQPAHASLPETSPYGADPADRAPAHEPAGEPGAPAEPAPDRPLTAAEKAKAEGRAQIVSPGFQPALVTSVLAALLAVTAPLGRPALAVPVVLLQAVTAAGWFRLNGMWPARQGIALAFLGGVVADAGLLATERTQAPTVLLGTLGVWILLVIVLQLRSHASPDERLYGLTAATASAALAVVAAGHLAADSDAVVVGALGVAVAVLARALPLPSVAGTVVALIAAAGAGVAGGQLTGMGAPAALLGLTAGVCALTGLRVASYDYPSRFVHLTAGVALPLALAAPAVYVLGRALG
ncbi:hypothetical protein [Streptomyces cinnamoneus]|uniref:hypothetical protein n=1 Tax=Streptomyces cinnamoneus TaxID=53446 RepID=UPI0037B4CAC3